MINRSFSRLFWSQAFANIGDVLYIMALIALLYEKHTSVFVVSLLPFLITMSKFSFGIVAPLVLDKYPLTYLLRMTQLLKVFFFIGLLISLTVFDQPIILILIFVGLLGLADGLQEPVSQALVPSLVSKDERVQANSLLSIQFQMTDLLTWSLGAVFVALIGSKAALFVTLIAYVVALLLAYGVQVMYVYEVAHETVDSVKASLLEGWKTLVRDDVLRNFLWMNIVKGIVYTLWVASILYVFVDDVFGRGEEWWGYLNASRIFGAILGGFFMYKIAKRFQHQLPRLLVSATVMIAILTLAFGLNTSVYVALVLVFFLGLPEQVVEVTRTTLTQQRVQEAQLAKVYTAQSMIYYLVFSGAVLVVGGLVDLFSVQPVFIIISLLLWVNVYLAFQLNQRRNKERER